MVINCKILSNKKKFIHNWSESKLLELGIFVEMLNFAVGTWLGPISTWVHLLLPPPLTTYKSSFKWNALVYSIILSI